MNYGYTEITEEAFIGIANASHFQSVMIGETCWFKPNKEVIVKMLHAKATPSSGKSSIRLTAIKGNILDSTSLFLADIKPSAEDEAEAARAARNSSEGIADNTVRNRAYVNEFNRVLCNKVHKRGAELLDSYIGLWI